eukprot:6173225-Pyramimonas_sp.AAC.1
MHAQKSCHCAPGGAPELRGHAAPGRQFLARVHGVPLRLPGRRRDPRDGRWSCVPHALRQS